MLCFVLFINIINKAPSKKTQKTAPDSKKAQKKTQKTAPDFARANLEKAPLEFPKQSRRNPKGAERKALGEDQDGTNTKRWALTL